MHKDHPYSQANPSVLQDRRDMIKDEHVKPFTSFVEGMLKDVNLQEAMGRNFQIPFFDPLDGGVKASILFLLEAPGPKAIKSGFVSRDNPDNTAKNFRELNEGAADGFGINRTCTVLWNIVPWYLGDGKRIHAATRSDRELAKPRLVQLLSLLDKLRIIVLVGRNAQRVEVEVCAIKPKVKFFKMPHPSPVNLNTRPEEREKIKRILDDIARYHLAIMGENR